MLVSGTAALLSFSMCPHMASPLCRERKGSGGEGGKNGGKQGEREEEIWCFSLFLRGHQFYKQH